MEIILGQARRHWSEDEKRSLVAETFVAGQTVNAIARRHNISRSMLFGWRKQYREALKCTAPPTTATGFTPVMITGPELVTPPASPVSPAETAFIELEFGRNVRLHISGAIDPDLVTAVMKALPRR
ncbi:MAG: transposase [Methylocapsa sp.]|nr:transposase [Methylocapsa sp.]